jgi:hypothetical protein
LITSLCSASQAGLGLENSVIEPELSIALTTWTNQPITPNQKSTESNREIIRDSGVSFLKKAGEQVHTLTLYSAGLVGLIRQGALQKHDSAEEFNIDISQLIKDFEENIAYRQGFLHYEKGENWWHQDLSLTSLPHSAQVEMSLVNLLVKHPDSLSEKEIYQHIYQLFPGLNTPRDSLLRILLESYGEKVSEKPVKWKLKVNDHPAKRTSDLKNIESILTNIGKALGFNVVVDEPTDNIIHLTWTTEISDHYNFFVSVSGLVGKLIDKYKDPPSNSWIVLPGSRAGLIYYKRQQNLILDKTFNENFNLVKFRHIRRLEEQGGLTHTNIQERLALDPFTSDSPQLQLI